MTASDEPGRTARDRQPHFESASSLHQQLGHPVRHNSNDTQAYCVVCMLVWTEHRAGWYSTDLVQTLADPGQAA